jgi:hypothetical protein
MSGIRWEVVKAGKERFVLTPDVIKAGIARRAEYAAVDF